jgi:hypothetical protein
VHDDLDGGQVEDDEEETAPLLHRFTLNGTVRRIVGCLTLTQSSSWRALCINESGNIEDPALNCKTKNQLQILAVRF